MKLLSALSISALASFAFAQNASIGFPPTGTTVTAGTSITVEVDEPDTNSSRLEVALVIGLASCSSTNGCLRPTDFMGTILYNGPYNPQFEARSSRPPHQNFTITIPPNFPKGTAQLNIAHFELLGASNQPFSEVSNITLIIS